MKLNFKEWNIVYEALTDKAKRIADDLKWHENWATEREADPNEDDNCKRLRAELATYTTIIKKLETSTI